jgi:hypothetical protein
MVGAIGVNTGGIGLVDEAGDDEDVEGANKREP